MDISPFEALVSIVNSVAVSVFTVYTVDPSTCLSPIVLVPVRVSLLPLNLQVPFISVLLLHI